MSAEREVCPRCGGHLDWVEVIVDDPEGTEWTESLYCPVCVIIVDEDGEIVPDENVVLLP